MQVRALTHYYPSVFTSCASVLVVVIAGCSSLPTAPKSASPSVSKPPPSTTSASRQPAMPAAGSGRGGYYQDDGPGDNPPANVLAIPDAEPKIEPVFPSTTRPYVVFGKTYTPLAANQPLKQRGIGSWYGKKFHGQKTASGERYDMYKMTAAHPTMPLPSYARVTNLSNGNQVIVRVNDRGPFHSSRIIDLSYTAAMKLGYVSKGSSELEVERLLPAEIARLEKSRLGERAVAQSDAVGLKPSVAASVETPAAMSVSTSVITSSVADSMIIVTSLPLSQTPSSELVTTTSTGLTSKSAAADSAIGLAPAATTQMVGSFFLQLGAFSQALNAEAARVRLARDASDGLPPLEVAQTGTIFKLYIGPFLTRTDAALAAQKMLDASGSKPFIVQR